MTIAPNTRDPETTFVRTVSPSPLQSALEKSHQGPLWEAMRLLDESTDTDINPQFRRRLDELLYAAHREKVERIWGGKNG